MLHLCWHGQLTVDKEMFGAKKELDVFAKGISVVFRSFFYLALGFVIAIVVAFLFFRFTSLPGQTLESWLFSVTDVTKWFVALYSILMGLLVAMEVYLWKNFGFSLPQVAKPAAGIIPGLVSGVIGIACCAPAIAGIALLIGGGTVGFISAHQIWFALPSLLLMLLALHFTARAVADPTCRF